VEHFYGIITNENYGESEFIMNETELKIYASAKKHFYEKGYYKATVRDIAQSAGVNSGLFNYYYKNKYNLAKIIYNEIYNNIRELVKECFSEEKNPVILVGVMLHVHTYLLYDAKIIKFAMDALKEGIIEECRLVNGRELVRNVTEYLKKNFTEEQINLLLAITLAAEKTVLNQKYAGNLSYDLKRSADVVWKIFLNGYDLENEEIIRLREIVYEKFDYLCSEVPDYVDRLI
jgi:AcrR family transcriptional regulator